MNLPLVSVVTPVLNRRETIENCLRCISSQTYPNVEHIVIDGGSTDGTTEILARVADTYRMSWISEPDSGMYNAINKGLRMAQGDILAYLNSDDLYLPYSIEAAVEALSAGRQMIYGDIGLFYPGEPPAFVPHFYPEFDLNYYTHLATLGQPTVFWTRRLTQAVGEFDESYRLLGDCEYWLRAATRGFIPVHVAEILAVQVEHGSTLRATMPELMQKEFLKLRAQYLSEAGPVQGRIRKDVNRRLRWRRDQLLFILAGSERARAWPRFMQFLRDHRINVKKSGLLWFLLPGPIRPSTATLLEPEEIKRALFD